MHAHDELTYWDAQVAANRDEADTDDYPEGAFLTPYDRDLPYEFQVDEDENELY